MSETTELVKIIGTDNEKRQADIVFVHGLGGDAWSTWHPEASKKDTNFWPMWLGEDLPQMGIWSLAYEVEPTRWKKGSTMPLVQRADNILDLLELDGIGERPVIFITHSMGGLLLKQMLRNANDSGNESWLKIVQQTKGIVYLSTPHSGSDIATWIKYIGGILRTSVSVEELEAHNPQLLNLNDYCRDNERIKEIPIIVYCENEKTSGVIVVDKTSANPGVAGVKPIMVDENHISISKPNSPNHRIYRRVKKFIRECLLKAQPLPTLKSPEKEPEVEYSTSNLDHKKKRLNNLPRSVSANFVGRETKLEELDQLLSKNERVSITAIAGMGGIGKTELALQYAVKYEDKYPGGICWLKAREEDLGTQIIQLGRILDINPPEDQNLEVQVQYCWRNWDKETSLIVFDDVPNYEEYYQEKILPYLPPMKEKFKVLMTSRQNPGANMEKINLDVLSAEAALELIKAIAGESRIEAELELAEQLCEWLGYLPLGLELVGRYLKRHKTLSLEKTLQRLKEQKLEAKALLEPKKKEITAQLGVAAAFELSWQELNSETQELGCYLSLFGSEPFQWSWVEKIWIKTEEERKEQIEQLEELRDDELQDRNLLKLTVIQDSQSERESQYQLHSLIQQYFRAKLEELEQAEELKQKFCQPMIEIAKSIPEIPTQKDIRRIALAIPHLIVVAKDLTELIDDENLIWSFVGLGRFYESQGEYNLAEEWRKRSLKVCRLRLGEEHPDVALSLNDLAGLYRTQGRYTEAESRYLEALELRKRLLGEEHPDVALSLNNLAGLYKAQGRYEKAEPLYRQALTIAERVLGKNDPTTNIK